jgi:hypothetical protein
MVSLFSRRSVSLVTSLAGCIALASAASAQVPRPGGNPQQGPPVRVLGNVVSVRPGQILFMVGNRPHIAQLDQRVQVTTSGTGDFTFLKPRMFISFTALVDNKGNVTEDVTEVAVFTPTDVLRTGVQDEGEGKFYVAGLLTSLAKTGKFTLSTGSATIRGTISPEAMVTINVTDPASLAWAMEGDLVNIDGRLIRDGNEQVPALITATRVDLKMVELRSTARKPRDKTDTNRAPLGGDN